MKLPTNLIFDTNSSSYLCLKRDLNQYSKWILLTDDNTTRLCSDIFLRKLNLKPIAKFSILPGEAYKNLGQVEKLYNLLLEKKLDRHAAIVNLGGGIVSDIGGYAAATFKRGIDYINIPTTLLAMVDASFGGKTGVNLNGVKNQIGCFHHPVQTLFDESFLESLPQKEMVSGYGEIIKHALIASSVLWKEINEYSSISKITDWTSIIKTSVEIKTTLVNKDPLEKSERKLLNYGHTIGHAIETLYNQSGKQISHGHAIAIGMITETYISHKLLNFPEKIMNDIKKNIKSIYGNIPLNKEDYKPILELLKHDKKNTNGNVNFVLLRNLEKFQLDCKVSESLLIESLDYYQS